MNRGRNESPESRRRRPRYLAAVEGLSNLLIFRTWPSGGANGGSDLLAGVSAGAGARRMAEHPGSARHQWPHDEHTQQASACRESSSVELRTTLFAEFGSNGLLNA